MKNDTIYRTIFLILLPIGLLLLFAQWCGINEELGYKWNTEIEQEYKFEALKNKQKGAHVFGMRDSMDFQFLTQNNIEWVTLVPWGFQEDYDSPFMQHHNGDSLRMQERDIRWLKRLKLLQSAGFKVFMKPHVWIDSPSEGTWRSDIFPTNNDNWELWKQSYRDFIFRYATIAEQADVEMFCIGTEFTKLSIKKPDFWKSLIQEVRTIYSGEITYAANWYDEYEKITFWEELDYIGIQAYFPLTKNKYPSVKQISKGWNKYLSDIKSIHEKYNRPVLFTEIGYKSTADSAVEPWAWIEHSAKHQKSISLETQANCYQAFFDTVWKKKWFAGAHIWQLRSNSIRHRHNGDNHLDFTPQGKPAEKVIAKGFE